MAWDAAGEALVPPLPGQDIPPGDWLHWTRNAQNWNGMCAECHSTNLARATTPKTDTYHDDMVRDQRRLRGCHGPGRATWRGPPAAMARPAARGLRPGRAHLGHQRSREQVELCAPCHSRRAELGDYDHPGTDLLDHLLPSLLAEGLYHPDGQIKDEVFEYGSFLQSKMYRMGVRCTDCHDAHTAEALAETNDALHSVPQARRLRRRPRTTSTSPSGRASRAPGRCA